jgi:hypothetical protein
MYLSTVYYSFSIKVSPVIDLYCICYFFIFVQTDVNEVRLDVLKSKYGIHKALSIDDAVKDSEFVVRLNLHIIIELVARSNYLCIQYQYYTVLS